MILPGTALRTVLILIAVLTAGLFAIALYDGQQVGQEDGDQDLVRQIAAWLERRHRGHRGATYTTGASLVGATFAGVVLAVGLHRHLTMLDARASRAICATVLSAIESGRSGQVVAVPQRP